MWKVAVLLIGVGAVSARVAREPTSLSVHSGHLSELCAQNGYVEKLTQNALQDYLQCFKDNVITTSDVENMAQIQGSSDASTQKAIIVVQSFCGRKNKIVKCYTNLLDALSPCTDPIWDKEGTKTTIANLADYVCYNNAERIVDILQDGALSCFASQQEALDSCMKPVKNLGYTLNLSVSESCQKYDEFIGCMVASLSKCPKQSTAEFVYRIAKTFSQSQCKSSDFDKNALLL